MGNVTLPTSRSVWRRARKPASGLFDATCFLRLLFAMLATRAFNTIQRRTFVSSVLLTRNWENESVNVLKKEAKKRGLLQCVLTISKR